MLFLITGNRTFRLRTVMSCVGNTKSLLVFADKNRLPCMDDEYTPLNVASGSGEEIGKLMSNFAHTPFVLDGAWYASVEGFYASLKFLDEEKRSKMARLYGARARGKASKSQLKTTCYQGESFELGSHRHHELIKCAIRAKLEQHSEIAKLFVATRPRPIIHDTGHAEQTTTRFPGDVFCRILTELREEFAERAEA